MTASAGVDETAIQYTLRVIRCCIEHVLLLMPNINSPTFNLACIDNRDIRSSPGGGGIGRRIRKCIGVAVQHLFAHPMFALCRQVCCLALSEGYRALYRRWVLSWMSEDLLVGAVKSLPQRVHEREAG